jgi:hypothetical protein
MCHNKSNHNNKPIHHLINRLHNITQLISNVELPRLQGPTLGAHTHAHTHAHGFWVGMGAMLLFMGGHGWAWVQYYCSWVGISFVHPCIQLQIGVKLLGCRKYANQEALMVEANNNEWPFICQIQPRLGVGG